jgi:adenylate kinase family enzyme
VEKWLSWNLNLTPENSVFEKVQPVPLARTHVHVAFYASPVQKHSNLPTDNNWSTRGVVIHAYREQTFEIRFGAHIETIRVVMMSAAKVSLFARAAKVHGLDDITGEPLVQRDDDQPASVRKRLDAYDAVTQPLIDYYEQRNILQSFAGTQSDVIYPQVKDWLQRKVFRYPQHH